MTVRKQLAPTLTTYSAVRAWIVAIALLGSLSVAEAAPTSTLTLPSLHVSGQRFVDPSGKPVTLAGVNIGGWLVTEGWMCGDKQSDNYMLERLESRFGEAKAAALMNAWYDNWFTIADLDLIQKYGFNVIRVPFGYRNLQNAAGQWHRTSHGDIDFSRFDWVVKEAAKRRIYVVFDMHIWPGRKEAYSTISRLQPDGDVERQKAAAIWTEVALHFKGNPAVAAFDLFNEPEGSPGDTLQRVSYEAIRKIDPQRTVMGEAMYYTNFNDKYWSNAVWSAHYPGDDKPGTAEEKVSRWETANHISDNPNVPTPIFIGEMKAPEDDAQSASELVQAMRKRGWSWAVWCYKAVNCGGWASFNYYGDSVKYDSATDSYDSLMSLWSTRLKQWQNPSQPVNYYFTDWWVKGFRQKP